MSYAPLPANLDWLNREPGPKMLVEGLKLYGLKEIVGPKHSPIIMGWATEYGIQNVYTSDEVAWCGLSHYRAAMQAGKTVPFSAVKSLWALNWLQFGVPVKIAMLGDTLVFKRPGGGHVGMYVGEDATCYWVLGGNEQNMYNIVRMEKSRCVGIRRPAYTNPPTNIRVIHLKPTGAISVNEA